MSEALAEALAERTDAVELAALLARDLDTGVRASLRVPDRVLVLDHVVARVGRAGEEPGSATWLGEVVLRAGEGGAVPEGPPGGAGGAPALPGVLAALPVALVHGVGPLWGARLAADGWAQVGALADATPSGLAEAVVRHRSRLPMVAAGRARACRLVPWEGALAPALASATLQQVLDAGPARVAAGTAAPLLQAVAAWEAAAAVAGALDERALEVRVGEVLGRG